MIFKKLLDSFFLVRDPILVLNVLGKCCTTETRFRSLINYKHSMAFNIVIRFCMVHLLVKNEHLETISPGQKLFYHH